MPVISVKDARLNLEVLYGELEDEGSPIPREALVRQIEAARDRVKLVEQLATPQELCQ